MNYQSVISLWKAAGKEFSIKAKGTSMFPLIMPGDHLSIQLCSSDNIRTGDIAAFIDNNNIIVHRIVKKKKVSNQWHYCQKGDNVQGWGWTGEQNILGRVESVRRNKITLSLLKGRLSRSNRVKGLAGWCLVTLLEKAHSVSLALGYHPPSGMSKIRTGVVKSINKIVQKI